MHALRQLELTVAEGEFLCLVGPSGCGKTTLLNIIGGLEQPTTGGIEFHVSTENRPLLSIVFQEQSVFPWMTALENAAFGLMARGVPKIERKRVAYQLLTRMGLERFAEDYPRELSTGMRQRVNLARAFANDPAVLLMDEPFASLDEQTRLTLQDELLGIWQGTRKTVLFVTHSVDEAIRLGDRVVVMSTSPGQVKAIRTVPLPRPRDIIEMAGDPHFIRLKTEIWQHLRGEMLAGPLVDGAA